MPALPMPMNGRKPTAVNDFYLGNSGLFEDGRLVINVMPLNNDVRGSLYGLSSFAVTRGEATARQVTVTLMNGDIPITGFVRPVPLSKHDQVQIDFSRSSGINSLAEGQVLQGAFWYTNKHSQNGFGSAKVTFSITGRNDAATISGEDTGRVLEAGSTGGTGGTGSDGDQGGISGLGRGSAPSGNQASGTLTVHDVDYGENRFQAPSSLLGSYGTFTFDELTGAWTYTLDDANATVDDLDEGETLEDRLTVTSLDGTATRDIVITIDGQNDNLPPEVSGPVTGTATEDSSKVVLFALDNATDPNGDPLGVFNVPETCRMGSPTTPAASSSRSIPRPRFSRSWQPG